MKMKVEELVSHKKCIDNLYENYNNNEKFIPIHIRMSLKECANCN